MLKLKLQSFGRLMRRSDSLERNLILRKIEGRRLKGMAEDEMAEWHHGLGGHELEQALGVGGRQRSLVCCTLWSYKELDMTE